MDSGYLIAMMITINIIQSLVIVMFWRSSLYWFKQESLVSRRWGETINERDNWIKKVKPLESEIDQLKQDKRFLSEAYNGVCRDRRGLQKIVDEREASNSVDSDRIMQLEDEISNMELVLSTKDDTIEYLEEQLNFQKGLD